MTYLEHVLTAVAAALLLQVPATVADDYPLMFASSSRGTADLGSWPETGGETGASAADAICQHLATSAHLDNSASFYAWISDSTTDAYCRVLGLAGKKANTCGQAVLPKGGPWLRTDDFPFSGTLQQLTSESMVLVPPRHDERGNYLLDYPNEVFTGTKVDGTWAVGLDCQGWTSESGQGFRGRAGQTIQDWGSRGPGACSGRSRLYCFEAGLSSDQLPDFEESGALVFATSARSVGNLGVWPEARGAQGLEAGDEICRSLAREAGLHSADSFVAWLSDSTINARDRFTFSGPWKRLDGVPVATDLADLTDGYIFTSISMTEKGDSVIGRAWTGTLSDGRAATTCDDWSNESSEGLYGLVNESGGPWTSYGSGSNNCSDASRIYCFSQVAEDSEIFDDGFESGDTTAWSSAVP